MSDFKGLEESRPALEAFLPDWFLAAIAAAHRDGVIRTAQATLGEPAWRQWAQEHMQEEVTRFLDQVEDRSVWAAWGLRDKYYSRAIAAAMGNYRG